MQLKMYLKFLENLNESTDDYLYLWDIKRDVFWFFGGINEQYALCEDGHPTCTMQEYAQIVYPKDSEILLEDIYRVKTGESEVHNLDYRLLDRNGEVVWISCRGKLQRDSQGNPAIMVGRVSDTAFKHKVDSLTRMFNKVKMSEDLDRVLATEEQGYLVLLGVDDLKEINIRHGRRYGNEVLKRVGRTLEDIVGNPQRIYRLDGDCFAVRMYDDSQFAVSNMYHKIKEKLAGVCTLSAGAVAYRMLPIKDADILYQYAEDAMDRAKKSGKDNLVFFSAEDYEKKLADIKLLEEIRNSVKNGCEGFSIYYQPQIEEHSYCVFGAEALLRYDSPTRGRVMPGDFIPILEKTGMIREVGLWVLEKALNQCKIWRQTNPEFHISVNVSYVQLQEENIAEKVLKVLDESDLPGEALTLEVTESMQLQDYPYYNKIFYQWKKSGIVISVDDFGTGYSSLGYLKSLKIDEIKIDRCFVSGIQSSAYNYRLLSNVLELAHSSQIRVCCEGIEEEDEVKTLAELNPDLLQGFFFAKPCDKDNFETMYIYNAKPEYHIKLQFIDQLKKECNNQSRSHLIMQSPSETIMDTLDEVIYVSDLNTNELLYMNHAACSMTGVYDYMGKKCYKVLNGTNAACEFCDTDCLQKEAFSNWKKKNLGWKKNYIFKSKLIDWNGKAARIEVGLKDSGQFHGMLNVQQREILNATDLGLWVIRMDEVAGKYQMYADDTMCRIMAYENGGTPEECYMHWFSRINDGYYDYVQRNVEKMIHSDKVVQLQYTWNHPYLGEVQVRCNGIRMQDMDGMICLEGYHRVISTVDQASFLTDEPSNEVIEYNERKGSIYFHTARTLLAGEDVHEKDFPNVWIENEMVHPNFRNKFQELFYDVQTKGDVKGVELLLKNKEGAYSWFKIDTRRLGEEARDRNTILVQLHAANQERVMELENLRIRDFYHASLSDTIAYAELDLESGYAHEVGGIWTAHERIAEERNQSLLEYFEELQFAQAQEYESDATDYSKIYKGILEQDSQTRRFTYKRLIDGEWRFVELVVHTFKEQFSENMYALIYLKDIDVEKRRYIEQEAKDK